MKARIYLDVAVPPPMRTLAAKDYLVRNLYQMFNGTQ